MEVKQRVINLEEPLASFDDKPIYLSGKEQNSKVTVREGFRQLLLNCPPEKTKDLNFMSKFNVFMKKCSSENNELVISSVEDKKWLVDFILEVNLIAIIKNSLLEIVGAFDI